MASEQDLYPVIARWLKKRFFCFATATNRGLRHGRVDVIGIRDVGGDLSGAIETIGVEVKRGSFPFANACGQTLGYRVYANRVYLADLRDAGFTHDEKNIASHLGIGLVQIHPNRRCEEVLSSPFYTPIDKLNLGLLEMLYLAKCQFCGCVIRTGDAKKKKSRYSFMTRENVARAVEREKGVIFWNREVAERKQRVGIRRTKDSTTYERRFVCPDCIGYFFVDLLPGE